MKLKTALDRSSGCLRVIDSVIRRNCHQARLVGGAVRDLLLTQTPKDFDICTTALPEEVVEMFTAEGFNVIPTGIDHGTVTVMCEGVPFEITTLRKDVETDGRHAIVEFTNDWKEDALRRDFTFNAMSVDLLTGELFDYFDGEEDLLNGKVRFVGSALERVHEDSLRILRYFRFLGRFEHCRELDPEAIDAIKTKAFELEDISGERIWMEMAKILKSNRIGLLSILMEQTGVLDAIGLDAPGTDHFSFGHIPDVTELEKVRRLTNDPVTMLAALILFRKTCPMPDSDVTHMLDNVVLGWKISADERDLLGFLVGHHSHRKTPDVDHYLDIAVDDECRDRVAELCALMDDEGAKDYIEKRPLPEFPVRGQDLLDAGMSPGPMVGQKLCELRRAWKESRYFLSRDELMEDFKP